MRVEMCESEGQFKLAIELCGSMGLTQRLWSLLLKAQERALTLLQDFPGLKETASSYFLCPECKKPLDGEKDRVDAGLQCSACSTILPLELSDSTLAIVDNVRLQRNSADWPKKTAVASKRFVAGAITYGESIE
eukprot:3180254-Prymnesium_polylepis.1